MTPSHYTYPTILPQHSGPSFFSEQLAHLEIAVVESIPVPRVQNHYAPPFEETVPGKTLAFLQAFKGFVSYRELGGKIGISRKSASTAINNLKRMGYKFEEQTRNQLMFVKLKITE